MRRDDLGTQAMAAVLLAILGALTILPGYRTLSADPGNKKEWSTPSIDPIGSLPQTKSMTGSTPPTVGGPE